MSGFSLYRFFDFCAELQKQIGQSVWKFRISWNFCFRFRLPWNPASMGWFVFLFRWILVSKCSAKKFLHEVLLRHVRLVRENAKSLFFLELLVFCCFTFFVFLLIFDSSSFFCLKPILQSLQPPSFLLNPLLALSSQQVWLSQKPQLDGNSSLKMCQILRNIEIHLNITYHLLLSSRIWKKHKTIMQSQASL